MNRTQEQVKEMNETHKASKQNNAIHSAKSLQTMEATRQVL